MTLSSANDGKYLKLVLDTIEVCLTYQPRFGSGGALLRKALCAFMCEVIGFDLVAFFEQHTAALGGHTKAVLDQLLSKGGTWLLQPQRENPPSTTRLFKGNQTSRRHGWLHLTPAYSWQFVQSLVESLPRESVELFEYLVYAEKP